MKAFTVQPKCKHACFCCQCRHHSTQPLEFKKGVEFGKFTLTRRSRQRYLPVRFRVPAMSEAPHISP
jgi:hypothetical protein